MGGPVVQWNMDKSEGYNEYPVISHLKRRLRPRGVDPIILSVEQLGYPTDGGPMMMIHTKEANVEEEKHPKNKNRVRFPDERQLSEVRYIPRHDDMPLEERAAVWISRKEYRTYRNNCKVVARDYIHQLEGLHDAYDDEDDNRPQSHFQQECPRGLETQILQLRYRQWNCIAPRMNLAGVDCVLEEQARQRQLVVSDPASIAAIYQSVTYPCQHLAYARAHQDAMAAKHIFLEQEEKKPIVRRHSFNSRHQFRRNRYRRRRSCHAQEEKLNEQAITKPNPCEPPKQQQKDATASHPGNNNEKDNAVDDYPSTSAATITTKENTIQMLQMKKHRAKSRLRRLQAVATTLSAKRGSYPQ